MKVWPVRFVSLPTFAHKVVYFFSTADRHVRQYLEQTEILNYNQLYHIEHKQMLRAASPFYTYVVFIILIEMRKILDDLLIAEILKGLFPCETEYLPEEDGK